MPQDTIDADRGGGRPPGDVDRLVGHLICRLVLHFPQAWPPIRGSVERFFSQRAPGWDERTGAGGARHLTALASAVDHIDSPPERALDVGCGTGAGTLFLAREYPSARVRGIDLSPAMIAKAAAKVGLDPEGRIAFRVADASDLPYEDETFDLVAQVNMPVFAAEARRVLRPGGHLIVATSRGDLTPFHTPLNALGRRMRRLGMVEVARRDSENGSYYLGRLPGAEPEYSVGS